MFVASSLARGAFNYARGNNPTASPESTPSNTRVKRRPKRAPGATPGSPLDTDTTTNSENNTSPPPSYDEVQAQQERSAADQAKLAVIDSIIAEQDLYKVLGIRRNAKADEVRRAFLNRSRVCHPDKFPNYQPSTIAFQKVSFAYETLSKPSSRRIYDVSGRTDFAAAMNSPSGSSAFGAATGAGFGGAGATASSEETLNGVLYSVFCEFMEGDFEMIRVLVNALNEGSPGVNLGNEAVDSLEGAFRRLRKVLLAGKKYLTIIRFELIRLYEIQHSLRQLSYFDVFGRLRLTLQLARVTLSIPMAIDQAMKEPGNESDDDDEYEGGGGGENGDEADTTATPRRRKRDGANQWSQSESESDLSDDSIDFPPSRPNKRTDDFGVVPSSDPEDNLTAEEAAEAEARRIRRQARMRAKAERERRRRARRANLEGGSAEASAGARSQRNSRVFEKDTEAARAGGSGARSSTGAGARAGAGAGGSPKLFPTSGQRTPTPSSPEMDSERPGNNKPAASPVGSTFDTSPPRDGTKVSGSRYSTPFTTPLKDGRPLSGQSFDDMSSPTNGTGTGTGTGAGLRPPFTHRRSRTASTPTGFSSATPSPSGRRSTLHPDDPLRSQSYGRAHGRSMSNASRPSSYHSPSGSSTFSSGSSRRQGSFGVTEEDENEDEDDVNGQSYGHSSSSSSKFGGSPEANARAAAAAARRRERERERKGILGPTAAGLLKGVVKVLETSEAWVPGSAAAAKREAEE
ncbi:unnamed protein product [Tilletia controversa]|uniref:J domain-containing protein n=1 Tax=Tilletia controversa TaxID=13291 RepID=A0A8X7T0D3_9BASI|nr:hypothetical protein CF328_g556 [Tilletia controversa]KAE8255889.1 hypothetical protein A4X06_0g188 [Tilletia controversa]CAD6920456.1 unnamed protein product [Tilletia controversa]